MTHDPNKTALNDHSVEAWRWNVDPAWSNFSAMIQDSAMFNEATTTFEKHRASKACLYFGVSAVEGFINQELRAFMRQQGQTDDEIVAVLPGGRKKQKWFQKTTFGAIYDDVRYKRFEYYKEIRHEVTHPVRKDQLISDYLDILNPQEFVDVVKYIFVKMHELQGKAFPYWVLGWNYIGFNFNKMEPCLSNNLNGFYHSTMRMRLPGYDLSFQMNFEDKYMKGYDAFLKMQKSLDEYPFNIEPEVINFDPPRLTRRWWDKEIILPDTGETFADDPKNPGCKLGWAVVSNHRGECAGFFDSEAKAEYICRCKGEDFEAKYASHNPQSNEVKLA